MTPEYLASTAAIVLSLLFSYVPGFTNLFEKLEANSKRLIMLALILFTAVISFGVSCAGWGELVDPLVACTKAGAGTLTRTFVVALIANQSVYAISPRKS